MDVFKEPGMRPTETIDSHLSSRLLKHNYKKRTMRFEIEELTWKIGQELRFCWQDR